MINRDESEILDGVQVIHDNVTIDGNIDVEGLTTTNGLKVVDSNTSVAFWVTDDEISFRKACYFKDNAQFNNGRTIIGMETTYNSAYVGSETIQAGQRLVLGDSAAKWDVASRCIIADTFKMTLANLVADNVSMKKGVATLV